MEGLNLSSAKILVCSKNCQSLDQFGNDLCQRRALEDREKINIHYVGHTPPPASPAEFLIGLSEEVIKTLKERDTLRSEFAPEVRFDCCKADGTDGHALLPFTREEVAEIPREEIGDGSCFICPKRRSWAKKSEVQKCVIIEHDNQKVLVDHFGAVLNLQGEEIPLEIDVPIPGNPGSEKVTYYPTSASSFNGHSYFFRKRERAPECFKEVEKHLFRSSPEVSLEIEESEILILQRPVNSSDWGHQSDIEVFRRGDKIAKHTPGKNRHLLKPGESVSLPESFQGGNGWHTQKFTFENRGGQLVKYLTEGRNFALKQAEILMSFGLEKDAAWKIIKASGPGSVIKAFAYGAELVRQFPEKGDVLLTALDQYGPPVTPGWSRTEKTIQSLGFPTPEAKNSGEFFRILAGARELVQLFRQGKYSPTAK